MDLDAWTGDTAAGRPPFPGAVGLLMRAGEIVRVHAAGKALRYADGSCNELPTDKQIAVREDTIFDLASITKLFTTIIVLRLAECRELALDAATARYVPEFAAGGKEHVTIEQLLRHRSGLPASLPLWRDWPDVPARIDAVVRLRLQSPPGRDYAYSDLNLIVLGLLAERATGASLDELVADLITRPLGMRDTGYRPAADTFERIAATEHQTDPPRGLVHGRVHDENAASLGGVAGHAGIFSTAGDLAILAAAVLNGEQALALNADTTRRMLTGDDRGHGGSRQGLGFELDQPWYMGALSSQHTAGHTGFTGTSLVLHPPTRSAAILLTNAVHPTREHPPINGARRAWADELASTIDL